MNQHVRRMRLPSRYPKRKKRQETRSPRPESRTLVRGDADRGWRRSYTQAGMNVSMWCWPSSVCWLETRNPVRAGFVRDELRSIEDAERPLIRSFISRGMSSSHLSMVPAIPLRSRGRSTPARPVGTEPVGTEGSPRRVDVEGFVVFSSCNVTARLVSCAPMDHPYS